MIAVFSRTVWLGALAVLFVGCNKPSQTSNKEEPAKASANSKPASEAAASAKPEVTTTTPPADSKPAEAKSAEGKVAEVVADKPAAVNETPAAAAPAETEAKPAVESSAESPAAEAPAAAAPAAEAPAELPAGLPVSTPNDAEPAEHTGDYAQWGSSPLKNNVCKASNLPIAWQVGKVDFKTGKRDLASMQNIKWAASLGSQSYANPVIAGGKVFIGTNNGNGYLKRYAADVDLGCLLAFSEDKGEFLWQYSSEKLPTGKTHDWELLGLCSTSIIEGDRGWFVDNRGDVVCFDTEGFYDDEDDGPIVNEWAKLFEIAKNEDAAKDTVAPIVSAFKENKLAPTLVEHFANLDIKLPEQVEIKAGEKPNSWTIDTQVGDVKRHIRFAMEGPRFVAYWQLTTFDKREADVVWRLDMMSKLGSSQHNAASCSGVIVGDLLFISTSNGVDAQHNNVPAPNAPSLVCLEKATGKVVWTDNSPGVNILHGQWSSPAAAVLGGVPQVIYPNGDGWLRSFRADRGKDGKGELLWEFDCNPKDSLYEIRGLGTRNHIIASPVIYKGHVYVAVGEDPEHGDGIGHLWCIDPTKRGDVSPDLAYARDDMSKPAAERKPIKIDRLDDSRRLQTIDPAKGEATVANPNSAMVWHYASYDVNQDGEIDDFQETMHRSLSTVTIKDDILYTSDFSGIIHCVDAKTGKVYWTHDMLGACWGSCLIADGKVYIGDEDGDLYIFEHSKEKKWLNQNPEEDTNPTINMGSSVLGTPIVVNNVLYIYNKNTLFAIEQQGDEQPASVEKADEPKADETKAAEESEKAAEPAEDASE